MRSNMKKETNSDTATKDPATMAAATRPRMPLLHVLHTATAQQRTSATAIEDAPSMDAAAKSMMQTASAR